jgi:hypothetical protein
VETPGSDPHSVADGSLNGGNMSNGNRFRKWAAQVARQAGEEPDVSEAQRLMSIAEYWLRLAGVPSFSEPYGFRKNIVQNARAWVGESALFEDLKRPDTVANTGSAADSHDKSPRL